MTRLFSLNATSRVIVLASFLFSVACSEAPTETKEAPKRGLRTIVVEATDAITNRSYPSVLEPADTTQLSFEVSGQLEAVNLNVGQKVKRGETLLSLDTASLNLQVQSARSSLAQMEAQAENARGDFERKNELFNNGTIAKAAIDQSRTSMDAANAQVSQAHRQLEIMSENLEKATIKAPFDGVISAVNAQSFENINPGQGVATIYQETGFEISFTVSYDVVNRMTLGQAVEVRVSDKPDTIYTGFVKELGSRAEQVSAFPVVIALNTDDPTLKAGLASQVNVPLPIEGATSGFLIPLGAMVAELTDITVREKEGFVYLYDEATSTVKQQLVVINGLREGQLFVSDGLKAGDRVAVAGVPFLRDGQSVHLLSDAR